MAVEFTRSEGSPGARIPNVDYWTRFVKGVVTSNSGWFVRSVVIQNERPIFLEGGKKLKRREEKEEEGRRKYWKDIVLFLQAGG